MNRRINIFCTSQAATAICLSMDEPSSSSFSSSIIQLEPAFPPGGGGGSRRAIDRYNPIITDSRRTYKSLPPSSPLPPSTPKPQNIHQIKNRKSTSTPKFETEKKKGSSKTIDQKRKSTSNTGEVNDSNKSNSFISRKSWSCTKPGAFITPPGSTRYLLSDEASSEKLLDIELPSKLNPVNEADKSVSAKTEDSDISPKKQPDQVVVLRVSLHCKACEKKIRKHISRMQGVTSFNIDFATNKVTVVGEVTPSEVLESISKVKNNAKLWTPLPPPLLYSSNPPALHSIQL